MIRKLGFVVALAVVAWAIMIVPLPLAVLAPTEAEPAEELITVETTRDDITGELLFTAVAFSTATTAEGVTAIVDPYEELTFLPNVVPQGTDPSEYLETQRDVFQESVQLAAAVALRAAGEEVAVSGEGARVEQVIPGSPAEGKLRPGDLIVGIDGEEVQLATQLQARLANVEEGEEVTLEVQRGDETVRIEIAPRRFQELDRPAVGVLVRTVNQQIDLPFGVQVGEGVRVGGPSAGLMLALTVYDLVEEGDLTGGRAVAGTGTITADGRVGLISGVPQKVRGAVIAGADVFLVPTELEQQAREAAPDDLTVVGIDTFDEALQALRDLE